MPSRVAALVPPAALVASDGSGSVRALLESVVGAAQDRAAALGERAHQATELAAGQKAAAVAASAAALAGGGVGVERAVDGTAPAAQVAPAAPKEAVKKAAPVAVAPAPTPVTTPTPAPPPAPAAAPAPAPKPSPTNEFAPQAATAAPQPAPARPAPGESSPGGGGGGSGGEFGP